MAFRQDMEARRLARLGAELRGLIEGHGGLHTRAALVDVLGCSDRDGLGICCGISIFFAVGYLPRKARKCTEKRRFFNSPSAEFPPGLQPQRTQRAQRKKRINKRGGKKGRVA